MTFIQHYYERFNISNENRSIYIVNVVLIFSMQVILMWFVWFWLTEENEKSPYLSMMHFDVVLTRLLCAFLMHMKSEPEVR